MGTCSTGGRADHRKDDAAPLTCWLLPGRLRFALRSVSRPRQVRGAGRGAVYTEGRGVGPCSSPKEQQGQRWARGACQCHLSLGRGDGFHGGSGVRGEQSEPDLPVQ